LKFFFNLCDLLFGYDLKSKVLGKGGDACGGLRLRRFHAKFIDGILHFPGLVTEH